MSIGDIPVPVKLYWDQAERIIEHLNVAAGLLEPKSERLAEAVRKDAELLADSLRVAREADADRVRAVKNATTRGE